MILQIIQCEELLFSGTFFIVSKGFCRHCSQGYLLGQVVLNSTLVIVYYVQTTQTLYFNSTHHLFCLKILSYANI